MIVVAILVIVAIALIVAVALYSSNGNNKPPGDGPNSGSGGGSPPPNQLEEKNVLRDIKEGRNEIEMAIGKDQELLSGDSVAETPAMGDLSGETVANTKQDTTSSPASSDSSETGMGSTFSDILDS